MMSIPHKRWRITLLCCVINFLTIGTARLSSIMFLEAIQRYSATTSQAAFAFTFHFAIRCLCGPAVGYIGGFLGSRCTTFIGCAISSLSVAACFLAEGPITFSILWAGLYGFGSGMGYSLLPEILYGYFQERSAMANGISLSGEGLAGFVLPVVMEKLIKHYGLSGALLILAGIMLQACPLVLFLKNPKSKKDKECNNAPDKEVGNENPSETTKKESTASDSRQPFTDAGGGTIADHGKVNHDNNVQVQKCLELNSLRLMQTGAQESCDATRFVFREMDLNLDLKAESKLTNYDLVNASSANQLISSTSGTTIKNSSHSSFRVFLDPIFITITILQSSYGYIGVIMIIIIVELGLERGVEVSNGSYLVMIYSIFNVLSRLCSGRISDSGYMSNIQFCVTFFSLLGVLFIILIFTKGFVVMGILLSIQGMCVGGLVCIFAPMCTQYIKKEHLTMALTSGYMLVGPLVLTQGPLIGYFKDSFGSYTGIVILQSVLSFGCALFSLLISFMHKRKERKRDPEQNIVTTS